MAIGKRILVLVLSLALVMGLTASFTASATPDVSKRVTIKVFLSGPDYAARDQVWKNLSEVCGDRLNADFDVTFVPWGDEYPQKLQLAISSGDDFDLCFDADWWSYNTLVSKGAYLNIADLAPVYMPNYYQRLKDTGNLSACFVGDGMYCIPWEAPYNPRPFFAWWDDRVDNTVTDVDASTISTMEDIDAFLQKAKALNPDNNHLFECQGDYDIFTFLQPKYSMAKWDWHYLTFKLGEDKITIVPEEQTPVLADAGYWAKKWVDDGIYPRDIKTNTAAHTTLGEYHAFSGFMMYEYIAYDGRWENPALHYSEIYPDGLFVNKSPTNNLVAINKNAANPERTLMFLDLIYADAEVFDALMYGIKGTTYIINDEGNYVWPEGMDRTNTNWMEWMSQWAFWRLDNMKPTPARSAKAWELNAEFLKQPGNVNNPLAGFVPDPSSIKNELAARDALYAEEGLLIEYGLVDNLDDAIAKYIKKQQDAGVDKIVAEVQRQVDEWLAGLN